MAKSSVSPGDLREFAKILQENIASIDYVMNPIKKKLDTMYWHDNVRMRFEAKYNEVEPIMSKLKGQMNEFQDHLNKAAAGLENEYLGNDRKVIPRPVSVTPPTVGTNTQRPSRTPRR